MTTFVKSTRCVELELEGDLVTMIPTRNEGGDEGFAPLPERARTIRDGSEEFGLDLLAALADAE